MASVDAQIDSSVARRVPPLPQLVQIGLIGLLIGAAGLAWAIAGEQMAGMDAGPGTDPGALGFFLGVWVVMMAAMMFPSIAPMVLMHARMQEGRRERDGASPIGRTVPFVGGYLITWAVAGLLGYGVYELGRAATGDAFAWHSAGPYLAGAIVVAAAAYQLTPLKEVCLRHCRSPLWFLMRHWRPGNLGALRMGIVHGGWCVGCCWALMAALFALGVMSLGWMALIAALIALEKLLPWKEPANRGIAALLLVLGVLIAFAPGAVPGLTLPDSPEAARAMEGMEGEGTDGGSMQQRQEGESMSGPDGVRPAGRTRR